LGDALGRMYRDVCARGEPSVLVGIAVDRVVEEVGTDAAVVEERVPLPRGAVADDVPPLAAEVDEQLEQRSLGLPYALGERRVTLRRAQPELVLATQESRH